MAEIGCEQLIDDLLAYSRVETTAKESGPVDMKAIVENTIKVLQVPIEESKAEHLRRADADDNG